ncbi:MAG: hypothetical protein WC119_02835 [Synergistaceae bacterium]
MKTENGIPIFESSNIDTQSMAYKVVMNAFRTLTESLVKLENEGASEAVMMDKCVWPILHEADRRFDALAKGDTDVPEGGFEYVVG